MIPSEDELLKWMLIYHKQKAAEHQREAARINKALKQYRREAHGNRTE